MVRQMIALALLAFGFTQVVRADEAADLLARWKAASGGAHWDAVKSVRTDGTLSAGGLSGAFDALQEDLRKHPDRNKSVDGYTPDQRFFLNFARVWRGNILPQRQEVLLNADPHAPAKFRAIAAPSNMPQFAEAFECKSGDPMVRGGDKQVKIW